MGQDRAHDRGGWGSDGRRGFSEAGTEEGRKAAQYVADRFKEIGLKPAGADGTWFHEFQTRDGIKGLLYFRDPSGNLFEMYCPKLKEAATFMRGVKQGGSYEIDFAGLNYEWNG